jgi:plasmid replication initiation protein
MAWIKGVNGVDKGSKWRKRGIFYFFPFISYHDRPSNFLDDAMENNLVVAKDNKLIQASYSLSVMETRVILLCLTQWDSRQRLPDDNVFTLSTDDVRELGVDKSHAYRDLKSAVNRLYNRTIKLDINEPDAEMRWITKKIPSQIEGTVTITFDKDVIPYISELKKRFTQYRLMDVAQFKNQYSVRIYELLVQFKMNHERIIPVQDFRYMLDLGEKYATIKDLKKYIITPALDEINRHSNLKVEFSQIKRGKEITNFVFKYEPKEVKHTATQKTQGTKPLIPLFTGHPEYTVDSEAILDERQRLKEKPKAKVKKALDSDKKSKITGLKRAVTHG